VEIMIVSSIRRRLSLLLLVDDAADVGGASDDDDDSSEVSRRAVFGILGVADCGTQADAVLHNNAVTNPNPNPIREIISSLSCTLKKKEVSVGWVLCRSCRVRKKWKVNYTYGC
jgi:hypothetical protein